MVTFTHFVYERALPAFRPEVLAVEDPEELDVVGALVRLDLGLANIDVMLGLTPERNLFHVFHEGMSLSDILYPTDYGFSILPAFSGVSEMLSLSTGQKRVLIIDAIFSAPALP